VLASFSQTEFTSKGEAERGGVRSPVERLIGLYQELRAHLPPAKSSLVTFLGANPGEGTSTIAAGVAQAASEQLGRQVAFIDIDSRGAQAGADGATLADVMTRRVTLEQALTASQRTPNLHFGRLTREGVPVARVISDPACPETFARLRDTFDVVLFDAPPFSSSGDGLLVGSRTDGVVLVVEAGATRWQVARSIRDRVTSQGGVLVGVVLNKRKFYIPGKIYSRL
jgi:Mrp family chromosome partitioning ATPase